jgi:hypothetical protein
MNQLMLESRIHPWNPNVYKDKCKKSVSNDLQYVNNFTAFKTHWIENIKCIFLNNVVLDFS